MFCCNFVFILQILCSYLQTVIAFQIHKKCWKVVLLQAKPSLKIRTTSAIFLIYLVIFRDFGLIFFFRDKTFLFFMIESWNFHHLFEKEFHETSQNFNSFSSFRQLLFSFFLSVVWLSWNFVRFHEILFQTDGENFSFLSWKTKKFYS